MAAAELGHDCCWGTLYIDIYTVTVTILQDNLSTNRSPGPAYWYVALLAWVTTGVTATSSQCRADIKIQQ